MIRPVRQEIGILFSKLDSFYGEIYSFKNNLDEVREFMYGLKHQDCLKLLKIDGWKVLNYSMNRWVMNRDIS